MIYIAAPFFTPIQLLNVRRIEDCLKSHGLPYFSPRELDVARGWNSRSDKIINAEEIFSSNVRGLIDSHMMIAVTDGEQFFSPARNKAMTARDAGVCFEMGFHFALGRPILTLSTDGQAANMMLSKASEGHFQSLSHMEQTIRELGPNFCDGDDAGMWFRLFAGALSGMLGEMETNE